LGKLKYNLTEADRFNSFYSKNL